MNRHERRAMQAAAGKLPHPVPTSISVADGPMQGWIVTTNAPCLREDWWGTMPDQRSKWPAGNYVVTDGVARWAPWADDDGPSNTAGGHEHWDVG